MLAISTGTQRSQKSPRTALWLEISTFLSNKEKQGDGIVRDPFRERMEDLIA
jgi:hypothetical protein